MAAVAAASGTVTTYYYAGGQRIALRQGGTVSRTCVT
jgi:hypothetical protein